MPRASLAKEVFFIRPMPFRCVRVRPVFSIRPQKATIWGKLVSRTFEKTAKPLGPSGNLTPVDGECTVVRPILFRCAKVKPVYPMRPQKATIWS